MTSVRYTSDSIKDEEICLKVEKALKSYNSTCFATGIAAVIVTGILSILLKEWAFVAFGGCFCVMLAMVITERLYKINNKYIFVTHATCTEEEKIGYRKQDRNYVFVLGDEEDGPIVKIRSARRHKFNAKGRYTLAFFVDTEMASQCEPIRADFISSI